MTRIIFILALNLSVFLAASSAATASSQKVRHEHFPVAVLLPLNWEIKSGRDLYDKGNPVDYWVIVPAGSEIKSANVSSVSLRFSLKPFNRASSSFPGGRLPDGHYVMMEIAGKDRRVLSEGSDRYWSVDLTEPEVFVGINVRVHRVEDLSVLREILKGLTVGNSN